MERVRGLFSLLVMCTFLTGCYTNTKTRRPVSAALASSNSTSNGWVDPELQDDSNDGYNCPADPNVLPKYDSDFDGTRRYAACTNYSDVRKVRIKGLPKNDTSICVFPALYVNSNNFNTVIDPATQLPYVKCGMMNSENKADFVIDALTNFNAVFVVELYAATAMQNCLRNQDSTQCPSYSYGKFRP